MKREKTVADKYIAPLLKMHSFKKRDMLWNRQRGKIIDVISIQQSQWNSNDSESFTVNVGIFVASIYEIVWQKKYKNFALEVDCLVRTQIDDLARKEFKILKNWWDLTKDEDINSVGNELSKAIENFVIPFFEKIKNLQDIHDYIEKLKIEEQNYWLTRIYFALVKKVLGQENECTAILDSLIEDTNDARAIIVKQHLKEMELN